MNIYLVGTPVKLNVDFSDSDGNPLAVTEAKYRVVDQDSKELLQMRSFDTTLGELTIPSEINTIAALDINAITTDNKLNFRTREVRVVEFELTLQDGNIVPHNLAYAIRLRDPLIAGLNSFQTMSQATLSSLSISALSAWNEASLDSKISALIEAYERICKLGFTLVDNLDLLSPKDFSALDARFVDALKKAQVAEADAILGGGESTLMSRKQGLLSQTIGETHETYQKGMPLDLVVSKLTMRYLSVFISTNKRIGRA
ncbi:hypothetical protein K023_1651 [Acinetobacter baumannii 25442_7]|uniref:hypothetical protein n=1 Tax=Acinetobacter baumannii TaxID=470 RepID=UPI000448CF19|nr:hypothetical protein [Acinetobacter baumannii]EZI56765.1 hypothetical protein K023_1651 [Acinetobacter baumannii 25442_7]